MILVDLSHTSHSNARTGIQRVARALHAALSAHTPTEAVCYDPHLGGWRLLEPWEKNNLFATGTASAHRGVRWPLRAKLVGCARRITGTAARLTPAGDDLIVPELFNVATARNYSSLFARVRGQRVAIFHDAIVLKYPELSPAKTVARFPGFMRDLLAFDGIAANSRDSQQCLLDYWRWLGVTRHPPVGMVSLGIDTPAAPPPAQPAGPSSRPPRVFCVGSLEGRKNHLALLTACDELWQRGRKFELHLVGLVHPQTGRAALEKLHSLQAAGRPLRYEGAMSDEVVHAAYHDCAFTVYPSFIEGFGLPVFESLSYGKPCICSGRGALGEATTEGGCLALEAVDAASLAGAIDRLLGDDSLRNRLTAEARARTFKTWSQYSRELTDWMKTLPPRS